MLERVTLYYMGHKTMTHSDTSTWHYTDDTAHDPELSGKPYLTVFYSVLYSCWNLSNVNSSKAALNIDKMCLIHNRFVL